MNRCLRYRLPVRYSMALGWRGKKNWSCMVANALTLFETTYLRKNEERESIYESKLPLTVLSLNETTKSR